MTLQGRSSDRPFLIAKPQSFCRTRPREQADSDGNGLGDACCCVLPIRGNVDYDAIDISDLVHSVYYMFNGGPVSPAGPIHSKKYFRGQRQLLPLPSDGELLATPLCIAVTP